MTPALIRHVRLRGRVAGFSAGVRGGGDGGFELGEGFGGFGLEAAELGGDARLDVQFEVFGAGAVGFGAGLEGVD